MSNLLFVFYITYLFTERDTTIMLALIKSKDNLALREVSDISLKKGHVKIKVQSVGLCRTDLAIANGTIPMPTDRIIGHEFSGCVVESDNSLFTANDRVTVNPYFGINQFMGLDFDGCLQEYVQVPYRQVIKTESFLSNQLL